MEVQVFDSWAEAQEEMERARRAADTVVRPFQEKIATGDYTLSPCEDEPVFSEVLETYSEPRMQHYRFVRSFSIFVEEGELGDLHVSQVLRVLTKEEFEAARECGWRFPETEGGHRE